MSSVRSGVASCHGNLMMLLWFSDMMLDARQLLGRDVRGAAAAAPATASARLRGTGRR